MKNPNEQPTSEAKLSLRERLEQWKQKKNNATPRKPIPNPDKPVKFEEMLRDNKPLPNQPKSTLSRLSSRSPSCTTSARKLSDASDLDCMTFHVNPKLSESHRKDLERSLNLTNVKKASQTPTPKNFKAPNTSFFTRSITMGDSRPGTCQKLSNSKETFNTKGGKGSALRFKDGSLVCKNPFEGLNLGRSMSLRSGSKKTPLREVKQRNLNEPAPVSKFDVTEEMFWERKPVQMEKEVDQFKMLCEDDEEVKRFESFLPEDLHLEVELQQTPSKLPEINHVISMEKPRGNVDEFLWSSNIELEEEIAEVKEPEKITETVENLTQEKEVLAMENKEESEQNVVAAEDTKMNEEIEEIHEEVNEEIHKEVHEEIQEKIYAEITENNENIHQEVNTKMNEEIEEKANEEVNEEETNENNVHSEINENTQPEEINKEIHEEIEEKVHEEEPIVQVQTEEEEVPKEAEIIENIPESAEKEVQIQREESLEQGFADLTNTREDSSNLIFEPSNDRIEEANKGSSRTASTTPVKQTDNCETSSSMNNEEKTEIEIVQNNENENENDEKSSLPINLELTQNNHEEEIIVNTVNITEEKEEEITLENTTTIEAKEQEEIIPSTAMLEEIEEKEPEIPQYIPSIPIPEEKSYIEEIPIEEYKTAEIPQQMTKSMTKSQTKKRKRTELEVLFEQASSFHGKESLKKVHLTNPNGREKAFATPHEKIKIELPQRSKGKASTSKKTVNESPAPAVSASKMIDEFGSELIFSIVNVKGKQGVEQQVTPVRRSMRLGSVSKSQAPFLSSSKQKMNLSFSGGFSVSKGTMKFIDDILKAPSNDIADIIRAVDEGTSRIKELTKGKKGLVSCSKSSANKCSIPMFKDLE